MSDRAPVLGPCDVCRDVFQDESEKETRWCPRCKAWLCESCRDNWTARAKAALKRALR